MGGHLKVPPGGQTPGPKWGHSRLQSHSPQTHLASPRQTRLARSDGPLCFHPCSSVSRPRSHSLGRGSEPSRQQQGLWTPAEAVPGGAGGCCGCMQ